MLAQRAVADSPRWSANGLTAWKTKDGKSIKELDEQA
jgi:hypothetical protein